MRRSLTPNECDIGHPKLFIGGAVGRRNPPPLRRWITSPPGPHQDGLRVAWLIFGEPFSRPGGPSLLTTSRTDDSELIDRPAGRGLTL